MRTAALLVALATSTIVHGAPRATIELLPEARIAGETVTLGQLARLSSEDLGLMRALVDLPVGRAPALGEISTVRRAALVRWLGQQAALAPSQLDWTGPEQTRVARAGVLVSGEAIARAAVQALRGALATAGIHGEVHVTAPPRDLHVGAEGIQLRPRVPRMDALRRRSALWVEIWSAAGFIRAVPVHLEVQLEEPPLRATVASARWTAVRPPALPGGRNLADAPLAVSRGEWAALRSVSGAVVLESQVQVLQDGRQGERIRVRQQGATGAVFARVLERSLLELAP